MIMDFGNDQHCKECNVVVDLTWNFCPMCGKKLPWFKEESKIEKFSAVFVGNHRTGIFRKRS